MVYLDTGCLVKLYYPEEDSEVVASKTAGLPIVFTPLHNLELTSAMRLKVFRQEATEEQVMATLRSVSEDLAAGKLIAIDNVNSRQSISPLDSRINIPPEQEAGHWILYTVHWRSPSRFQLSFRQMPSNSLWPS